MATIFVFLYYHTYLNFHIQGLTGFMTEEPIRPPRLFNIKKLGTLSLKSMNIGQQKYNQETKLLHTPPLLTSKIECFIFESMLKSC